MRLTDVAVFSLFGWLESTAAPYTNPLPGGLITLWVETPLEGLIFGMKKFPLWLIIFFQHTDPFTKAILTQFFSESVVRLPHFICPDR